MSQEAYRLFWRWFLQHEEALRNCDPSNGQYEILHALGRELRKIDPDLTFELGPADAELREMTISANGVRELIPVVRALFAEKPEIERWEITAFRQRKKLQGGTLCLREFQVSPEDVLCCIERQLRRIDIKLFVDGYRPEDYYAWLEISFLLLDAAVGELDVAMKIGEVSIQSKNCLTDGDQQFSLVELPERFDRCVKEYAQELRALENLPADLRKEQALAEVIRRTSVQAEALEHDSGFIGESICLELYFRESDEHDGGRLMNVLRKECGLFVERVLLGGVIDENNWVHCWSDQPRTALESIAELISDMAERGGSFGCFLEGAFVSPAEQGAMLDCLFGSLDLNTGSHAAMAAHQEIEAGKLNSAVAILEEALEEEPDDLELRGLLAYAYAKSDDAPLAEEFLDELLLDLQGDTDNPATFWNIACAFALLQDAKRACESLSIALELDPALREVAIADPDLAPLKGEPDFVKLLYQA